LYVESFAGQWARDRPVAEPVAIASSSPRPPLSQTPPPGRSSADAAATLRDDSVDFHCRRTLLLIDGVRLRRECLLHLLSAELPDFDVIGVATTQPSESWSAAAPHIVLFSAPATGADSRSRLDEIVAAANGAPVLLLTESEACDGATAASEPGVVGQFPSACGAAVLIAAIRLALAGGRFQLSARPEAAADLRHGNGAAQ
jgi:DNA-binding NarL/FixJ family response regulator